MKRSTVLAGIAFLFLALAAITGATAFLSKSEATGTCTKHPCDGYSYEVLYEEASGKIVAIRGWDPSVSPAELGTRFRLRPGEQSAVVSGDQAIGDILNNANDKDYAFDSGSGEIKRVAGESGVFQSSYNLVPSLLRQSEALSVFSLALALCASVASVVVRKRSGPE